MMELQLGWSAWLKSSGTDRESRSFYSGMKVYDLTLPSPDLNGAQAVRPTGVLFDYRVAQQSPTSKFSLVPTSLILTPL